MSVQELVDSFESFQHCGPAMAAAIRINGTDRSIEILSNESDWSHITKGRPVVDCRVRELPDLEVSPRAILRAMATPGEASSKKFGMSMR